MERTELLGMPLPALAEEMKKLGQPAFRAGQLFGWLHQKQCGRFAGMENLPLTLRQELERLYVAEAPAVARRLCSQTDGTVKLLLRLRDGNCVETVLMRYRHGATVCVSSQAGCRMGCRFCASAQGGLVRNLSSGEMVAQVNAAAAEAGGRVDNVVLMGIGEPLDNFDNVMDFIAVVTAREGRNLSGRGICLSTCGVVPGIDRLARRRLPLTLSVSLHAPTDEARDALMPVNRSWPLAELLAACRRYREETGRRVSYEYAVMAGQNDADADADALAALLAGTDGHVNLIPANEVPGAPYRESRRTNAFAGRLKKQGMNVTVRRRMGADIAAACGQLRVRAMEEGQAPPACAHKTGTEDIPLGGFT